MAIPEHVEAVRRGAAAISKCMRHRGYGEVSLDLSGANLDGLVLTDCRLGMTGKWNQERKWVVDHVDLSGASLKGAKFTHVNLDGATAVGVDMSGSQMVEVVFGGTDLSRANLERAVLVGSDLDGAVLAGASLRSTALVSTTLRNCTVSGADLGDAYLEGVTLSQLDLSAIKGLATVRHGSRTIIGVDVLESTIGPVPLEFLRGCGVSEQNIRLFCGPAHRSSVLSAFISYSRSDSAFAQRLYKGLQKRGVRCWMDDHAIAPGEKILTRIDSGIQSSDRVVLCCSNESLSSWWVDKEIGKAFAKEERLWRERGQETLVLLPIDLDGHLLARGATNFLWSNPRADEVRERMAVNFVGWATNPRKFSRGVDRLAHSLGASSDRRCR